MVIKIQLKVDREEKPLCHVAMVAKFLDLNTTVFLQIWYQGGLATAFDLAAFWLSMVAPVKKSVNHSRIVASMRETGWKQKQQEVCLRSDSTV